MDWTSDDDDVQYDSDVNDDDLFAEEEEEELVEPDPAVVRERHQHLEELLQTPGVNERDLREAVEDLTEMGLGGRVAVARLAVSYGNDDLLVRMQTLGVTLDNLAQYVTQEQGIPLGMFLGMVANNDILDTMESMGFVPDDIFVVALAKASNEDALEWLMHYLRRVDDPGQEITGMGWFEASVQALARDEFDKQQILMLVNKLFRLNEYIVVLIMVKTEDVLSHEVAELDEEGYYDLPQTTLDIISELITRVGLTVQDYEEQVAPLRRSYAINDAFKDLIPVQVSPLPGLDITFDTEQDAEAFRTEWERARASATIPVISVPQLPETCFNVLKLKDVALTQHGRKPDRFVWIDEKNATCMSKSMLKAQLSDPYSNLFVPCVQNEEGWRWDDAVPFFFRTFMENYSVYIPLSQIIALLEMDMPAGQINIFKLKPGQRYERSASFRNSVASEENHVSAVFCNPGSDFTASNLQRVEVARAVRGKKRSASSIALTE